MISRAKKITIKFFSMVYLVMLIERSHDYDFATQARILAVLPRLGQPQSLDMGRAISRV